MLSTVVVYIILHLIHRVLLYSSKRFYTILIILYVFRFKIPPRFKQFNPI